MRHRRRSIRLKGYDYTRPGAYFVTIVTDGRRMLFGEIIAGEMRLNTAGRVAERCWLDIPNHYPHAGLDAFVVMPNHIHGIIVIRRGVAADGARADAVGANDHSPLRRDMPRSPSKTIGSIVRGFKIGVTKWFRGNTDVHDVWQRNYYEHIVRNERSLNRIRRYILENPARWHTDRANPRKRQDGSARA